MKKLNFFEKIIGSGFYTGYVPFASGTFGSLAGLIIYYIPGFEKPIIIIPVTILFIIYGIFVGSKFEKVYGKDPSECTVDEVAGTWISLLFVPKIWWVSLIVFFLWRLSDIIKPFPARRLEKLEGGLGIMIDDIISSLYVLLLVHLYINLFG